MTTTKNPEATPAPRIALETSDMSETVDCPVLKKKFPISLKPCPFCGGKPEAHKCPDGPIGQDGRMTGGWYLRCLCNSGSIFLETIWHLTLEAAVDSWNARSVPVSDYTLLASDCIFDDQNKEFVFTETCFFYTVRFKKNNFFLCCQRPKRREMTTTKKSVFEESKAPETIPITSALAALRLLCKDQRKYSQFIQHLGKDCSENGGIGIFRFQVGTSSSLVHVDLAEKTSSPSEAGAKE